MNRIISSLGIPKSTVYYKTKKYPLRKYSKRKELSKEVEKSITEITSKKSTHGIPRVRAILSRDYGLRPTKYMVQRFMKEQSLLITRNRTRGVGRDHSGTISVDTINTRWASDITSIKCWNGEKLRVAIILDCCDRSVIAWKAAKHIQACDIELLVQEAILKRFKTGLVPEGTLQFLHDNGPEYIEKILKNNLMKWNIENCNTPIYSPQSNGMVEAFNGTLKRDYVYENCLETAESVQEMIPSWIEEYNNYAPHSALNMKTPTEYFNYKQAA